MKKYNAFSLFEVLLALVVLALLIVLTVAASWRPDEFNEKKVLNTSKNFYMTVENAYLQYALNTPEGNRTSLGLKNWFVSHADGVNVPAAECSRLATVLEIPKDAAGNPIEGDPNTTVSRYIADASANCANFRGGIVAGFVYNTRCNLNVPTKEYYNPDNLANTPSTGSCGYVVYGYPNSKYGFTHDVFAIALGRNRIK